MALVFQNQHMLASLRAGEPRSIARAFALEAIFHAASGGIKAKRRALRLVERCREMSEAVDDANVRAWAAGALGLVRYQFGEWRLALDGCERGVAILRGQGLGNWWEISSGELYALWTLFYLGEIAELERRVPRLLKEARTRGDLYAMTNLCTGPPSIVWLANDDPESSQRIAAEAMERWSHRRYHLQHHWYRMADVNRSLYLGEVARCAAEVDREWLEFKQSLLVRLPMVNVENTHMRARCLLATASAGAKGKRERQIIAGYADRIGREKVPPVVCLAHLLRAGVAALAGDDQGCRVELERSIATAESAEMGLIAASARRRLGELLGGDRGAEMIATADAWMSAQNIARPERMVEVFAPGFSR